MQVVTGMPESPLVHEIPAAASSAIAVADNGAIAAAGADGVRISGPALTAFALPLPAGIRALAFARNARDLIAMTGSGDLFLAKSIEAGIDIRSIAYQSTRLLDPVAVRFSADGSAILAADASGRLASILLGNGDTREATCACAPTGLQPLNSRGLVRVTNISDQPLFLFDTSADRPRVWFVPMADRRSAQ
jgi:hypothetical protein